MALIETNALDNWFMRPGHSAEILARDHGSATTDQAVTNFRPELGRHDLRT